jgi:hypothetical protein
MAIAYADSTSVHLTGTALVEIMAAPSTGYQNIIQKATAKNRDTVSRTLTLVIHDTAGGGADYELESITLAAGASGSFNESKGHALGATTKSLKIKSDAAAATTEPDATCSFVISTN